MLNPEVNLLAKIRGDLGALIFVLLKGQPLSSSGYNEGPGIGQILLGTAYAFADGAIIGALFAWLYNRFLGRLTEEA